MADDRNVQSPPLASVLLPVYNGDKYLAEAIESILHQTLADFELLLLDDGSTDGSRALMEAFAATDPRCRLFSWPNQGIVATLNAGLAEAKGTYIVRMDADDICLPSRLEKQIGFLVANPDHVAVGSQVQWIDPEGMPLRTAVESFSHEDIDAQTLKGNHVLYHPAITIRTNALKELGGYRFGFKHAEDLDLFLRLGEVGKLANIPEVLLRYRQHFSSVGMKYAEEQRKSGRRAIEEACLRRGIDPSRILGAYVPPPPSLPPWELHQIWGWCALQAGHRATARKHAVRALASQPFNRKNWLLAACVLRGR